MCEVADEQATPAEAPVAVVMDGDRVAVREGAYDTRVQTSTVPAITRVAGFGPGVEQKGQFDTSVVTNTVPVMMRPAPEHIPAANPPATTVSTPAVDSSSGE
jgi:hypothetical protein